MMNKRLLMILALLAVASLVSGCVYLPLAGLSPMYSSVRNADGENSRQNQNAGSDTVTISAEQYARYQKFDKLLEMMDLVEENYYQPVDESDLLEAAEAGMLMGLKDPYTFYYTAEDFAQLWEDDEGEYCGIGIQITASYVTGICTISRVFEGGPAREAGVLKGDILYKVEDMFVTATNLQDAVDIMRGIPDTEVNVVFLRNGEEIALTLTRAVVNTQRVEGGMLDDQIGYICLYEFAGDCDAKFKAIAEDLVAQGAKGMIIDLRDNPGGWVESAQNIADLLLDAGTLCYLEYVDGSKYYYRTQNGTIGDLALVILVNENSASSSEILTGCLKDRANATVVGKQSYGKGIVQIVVPISEDGSGMQMTVAQYFTPNGNAVHKIGITPDVEIDLDEGDLGMHPFGDLTDAQLARALEIMKEKLAK